MFCANCGIELSDDANFCFNCGAKTVKNQIPAKEGTGRSVKESAQNETDIVMAQNIKEGNRKDSKNSVVRKLSIIFNIIAIFLCVFGFWGIHAGIMNRINTSGVGFHIGITLMIIVIILALLIWCSIYKCTCILYTILSIVMLLQYIYTGYIFGKMYIFLRPYQTYKIIWKLFGFPILSVIIATIALWVKYKKTIKKGIDSGEK